MRAAPAKFLFENDFAPAAASKPSIALDEHAAKLKEAEAAAFARGFAQGAPRPRPTPSSARVAVIERIAAALERARPADSTRSRPGSKPRRSRWRSRSPGSSRRSSLAREPFAEIAALATGCFRNLVKCPHVVVRVNDALHETAREKLDEIVRRCSPDTRLVVLAEPDIAPGDCRIEWADGGIDRDSAAIAAAIDEAVARYINARRSGARRQRRAHAERQVEVTR